MALGRANGKYLENNRSPSMERGGLDTRQSHFYLTLYWAQALAQQDEDVKIKGRFSKMAREMELNEEKIIDELSAGQSLPLDLGGYYNPDPGKTVAVMRPSTTFNGILEG
jgi:isocitrate dehydrogenase